MKKNIIISLIICACVNPKVFGAVNAITLNDTSIFRYASSGSAKIGTIPQGSSIVLVSPKNSYYEIFFKCNTGWIKKSSVQITMVDGYVTDNEVSYRSSPHDADNILGTFSKGTELSVTAIVGDYCEIRYGDITAYVQKDFIYSDKLHLLIHKQPLPLEKVSDLDSSEQETVFSGNGKDIAFLAMDYIGGNYVWGGNNLETGVDCSGFVRQIYKKFGIILEGPSYILVKYGKDVSIDELTYGDLVFFTSGGSGIGHVGIYVSNNYFIHAASTSQGIIISKLSTRSDFVTARRIIY